MEIGDKVRVIATTDTVIESLDVGSEGILVMIDEKCSYKYFVVFHGACEEGVGEWFMEGELEIIV